MSKKLEKNLKKANKNLLVFLVLFFMLTTATFAYLWLTEYPSPLHKEEDDNSDASLIKNNDGTYNKILSSSSCDNLEVYYLDLKGDDNETKIGDSTYIKCNNIDIVIDAGIKNVGSNTVVPFLKDKVTDKKIELTIITHTDNDHIGGFVGLSNKEGVLSINDFKYEYILESGYSASTQVYTDMMEIANSTKAKICTANDSITGNNKCAKTFKIGDITLDVIDTGFYSKNATANNKSVVTLLTHNSVSFLFPGDLEDDETLANNLNHVDIFKASHHGASSANSSALLNKLTPETIIISAGLDGIEKYDIPQQESLDRMYEVTNNIYATFTTGTIKITSNGETYQVSAPTLELFQNTEWFLQNRALN